MCHNEGLGFAVKENDLFKAVWISATQIPQNVVSYEETENHQAKNRSYLRSLKRSQIHHGF
jgi:hypothetical protein